MIGNEDNSQYKPGSCNIGQGEIRRRYRIGFIGLFLAVVIAVIIHMTNVDRIWKLIVFIPVFYSVSGFIQAVNKFCYVYGFRHIFSVEGMRKFTSVRDELLIKQDRKRAIQIVTMVMVYSIVITALYYFLVNLH